MVGNTSENNMVTISGKVASELEFSHEVYGEGFYLFYIEVPRLSNSVDLIPATISERLIHDRELKIGNYVEIEGQFRSYNNNNIKKDGTNKLFLTIFVRDITFPDDDSKNRNPNQIYINGYICKKPIYRTTPFGREIADLLVAVNRQYNKSDYIPCIAWGRNARFCGSLEVGDNVKLWGRIQSREYQKKLSEEQMVTKVAYEVSITKLDIGSKQQAEDVISDTN